MKTRSDNQRPSFIRWTSFLIGIVSGITIARFYQKTNKQPIIGEIEVLFTYPKSFRRLNFVACETKIIQLINKAKKSIYVQSYSFTSKNIVNALITAKERGLVVHLLLDKENEIKPAEGLLQLIQSGIPVKIRRISGISHSKIIIIDEEIVQTGSYNYTRNANERNDENIIVIYNSPSIVKLYLENWKKCNLEASHIWGSATQDKPWKATTAFIPRAINTTAGIQQRDKQTITNHSRTSKTIKEKTDLCPKHYLDRIASVQNSVWLVANMDLLAPLVPTLQKLSARGIDIKIVLQGRPEQSFLKLCSHLPIRQSVDLKQKMYIILDKRTFMKFGSKKYVERVTETKLDQINAFCRDWNDAWALKTG